MDKKTKKPVFAIGFFIFASKNGEIMKKIKCPYCGYEMPITYSKGAVCKGIFVKCKGKNCKKEFEIKINTDNSK